MVRWTVNAASLAAGRCPSEYACRVNCKFFISSTNSPRGNLTHEIKISTYVQKKIYVRPYRGSPPKHHRSLCLHAVVHSQSPSTRTTCRAAASSSMAAAASGFRSPRTLRPRASAAREDARTLALSFRPTTVRAPSCVAMHCAFSWLQRHRHAMPKACR